MASAKEIPPGGEGKIDVTFKSKNRKGKATKTIRVMSNDPANPTMQLTVKANLEVLFAAEKSRVWFSRLKKTEKTTQTVQLSGKELEKVKIVDIRLDTKEKGYTEGLGEAITWKLNDNRAKGEKSMSLDITLDPAKLKPGRVDGKLIIETNLKEVKTADIRLSAEILGPISIVPPRIYFSNFETGVKQNKIVKVESNDGKKFKILSATIADPEFKVESFDKSSSDSHSITVTFNPGKTERVKSDLMIKTDTSEQPELRVNIHGYMKRVRKGTSNVSKLTDLSAKQKFKTEKSNSSNSAKEMSNEK